MVLVKVSGIINKNMLISGSLTVNQFRLKLAQEIPEKKSFLPFVQAKNGKFKIHVLTVMLKDLHEMHSDN